MGDYRKVLRTQFIAICNNCNHSFELDHKWMQEKERRDGIIPFSAKSSNTSVFCPECRSFNFSLTFNYNNIYRRRCPKCGKMFETEKSWKNKCDNCAREHVELIASMGPG